MQITNQRPVNNKLAFGSNLSRIIRDVKKLETLEQNGAKIEQLQQVAERINSRFAAIPEKTGNTVLCKKYGKLQDRLTQFYLNKVRPRIDVMKNDKEATQNNFIKTFSILLYNAQTLHNRVTKAKELSVHKLVIGKKSYRFDNPKVLKRLGFLD